ncbi:MAG: septum site-determining protein MinC [Anaerolineales bacterium]
MIETAASPIQIKGIRDGLLATCANTDWQTICVALLTQIDARPTFFQGARLALEVGALPLKVNDLVDLRDHLSERSVALWAIISESPLTEQTAQLLGLATRISKPRPEENRHNEPAAEDSALFITKTLRSGQRVEYPGNIVIYGDVNAGAEIIAGGHVIVWGRVRGMIHAGANGDAAATICALDLSATQIRIADKVSAMLKPQKNPQPEVASISSEGVLQSEVWHVG